MKKNSFKTITFLAVTMLLLFAACRKNDYFNDGGGLSKQPEAEKRMPLYDFLVSRPNHMFDSLVKIIDLTNAKSLVNEANITFFAAPNNAVRRLQLNFVPSDKQQPRPLSDIGKDTLLNLLKRFIVPNAKVSLEVAVQDKQKHYPANNGDSLVIYGKGGGTTGGSSQQTTAYYIEYMHRKIPNVDSVSYTGGIQTHNLITANAIVHVLKSDASFAAGLQQKYYR